MLLALGEATEVLPKIKGLEEKEVEIGKMIVEAGLGAEGIVSREIQEEVEVEVIQEIDHSEEEEVMVVKEALD